MSDANLLDLQRRIIALVIASGVHFPGDVWSTVDMRIGGGLYVGSTATDPPADDIDLDGDIRGAGGAYFGSLATDPAVGDVIATVDGRFGGGLQVGGVATDPVISTINTSYQFTLTGALSDEFYCGLQESPSFTGGFTIARHNYITLNNPVLAGGAAVTDACIIRFNAAAGTHKALLTGTTHPHPATTDAWVKININGTIFYIAAYTHTT